MHQQEAFALCHAHMNKFVRLQMNDGAVYDGVIEHVDGEHVFVACPVREEEEEEQRALTAGFGGGYPYGGYPYGGYPYGGYPYGGYPYGYHYPRYRRYALPLAALLGLTLLPYIY